MHLRKIIILLFVLYLSVPFFSYAQATSRKCYPKLCPDPGAQCMELAVGTYCCVAGNCVGAPYGNEVYTFFGPISDTGSMEMLYVFVTKFLYAMYGISVSLAVLMIILSGFAYITAGGDEKAIKAAKERLQYAIIGLIIILMSTLIYAYMFQLFY